MRCIKHYAPRGPRLFLDFSVASEGVSLSYERKLLIRRAIAETLFYERILFAEVEGAEALP